MNRSDQVLCESEKPVVSKSLSRWYALLISLTYLTLTCLWIEFSTTWVVHLAGGSVERIEQLQKIKGFCFMLVTSIAFYFSIRWVSKKSSRNAQALQETYEKWREAERQAAPALLASCIAHDVANLLTVMRLHLERIKRVEGLPATATDVVSKFDAGTQRLMELVRRLRGASTALFQEEPSEFDFSKVVEQTLSFMQGHVFGESARLECMTAPGVMLRGYPILVHQLTMNLLLNAAEATHRVGHVRLTIHGSDEGVSLLVEDDGPGIEPNLREKVIGAFFTTKSTGSGLGLTSVRSCVDIHQGKMEISDSKALGGARFKITLLHLTADRVNHLRRPEAEPRSRFAIEPISSH